MNQINMSRIEDAEKKRILLEKEKEYNFLENLIKKNEKIKSKNFKSIVKLFTDFNNFLKIKSIEKQQLMEEKNDSFKKRKNKTNLKNKFI